MLNKTLLKLYKRMMCMPVEIPLFILRDDGYEHWLDTICRE